MTFSRTLLLLFLITCFAAAVGQTPDLEPRAPRGVTPVPTLAFSFEMTGADPAHYDVAVEATGRAAYYSTGHADHDSPASPSGDPYILKFAMSAATRQEIFDLADRAHDFEKSVAYTKSRIANMGAKTITYADDKKFHQQTYNYSAIPAVQQLTDLMQNISNTLESGRRLEYLYKYEKLGVDEELKNMEEAAKNNQLAEVQALAPLLKQIASDQSVLNIARQRAQKLLKGSQ